MSDPFSLVALSGSALLAVGLASAALLKAWHGWLELRRMEVDRRGKQSRARPEIVELRSRVRRLEAIASGEGI
jgi:hypothetical protein